MPPGTNIIGKICLVGEILLPTAGAAQKASQHLLDEMMMPAIQREKGLGNMR
jgi:hypothetical protein